MSSPLCCFQPNLESVGICAALCGPSACGAGVTTGPCGMSTVTVTGGKPVTSVLPWLLAGALGIWLLTRKR